MKNYYTNLIKDLKTNFENSEKKLEDLITKIDNLLTTLNDSSGDNIDEIKKDLSSHKAKFTKLKENIRYKLGIIESNATTFDSWLKKYNNLIGISQSKSEVIRWGLFGWGSTEHFQTITSVNINSDDGLIYIKYFRSEHETRWWDLKDCGEKYIKYYFNVIPEMEKY